MPSATEMISLWEIAATHDRKPSSLVIALRRRIHVLPWFHFRHAEGNDSLIKITFSTHVVGIQGTGLTPLLKGIASHLALRITEPTENEAKFGVSAIASIDVKSVEEGVE
jgi:hypothetical protein